MRRPITIVHCLALGFFIALSMAAGLGLASAGDRLLPAAPASSR